MKLFVLFIVSLLLAEEATARNELPRCGPELESGFIGVGFQEQATQTIKGAVVGEVLAGGPAEQAGMRKGDVIVSFAGAPVSDFISLVAMVSATQPGSLATVQVLRKSFFSAERTETLRVEVKGRTGGAYARGWSRCRGSRTRIDGALEEGEYLNGLLHGQGEITLANGNRYVGEFKDGQPNGQGNYTAANGDLYVGEFKDGQPNGQGNYTYANGNRYVGEFREGKHHGQGILTFASGRKAQEGLWENHRFVQAERIPDHIAGRSPASPPPVAQPPLQLNPPASATVGQSSLPTCSGSDVARWTNCAGTRTTSAGDRYVGEFRDGKYHGQGTYTAANGDLYVGEYKEGVRNGRGIYTYANGRPLQEGIWANDKFVRAERIPDHIAGRSPASPPPVAPAVSPATLEPTAPGFYRFKRGDTLISIALEHGVDWRELAAANDISNPNVIEMGRLLIIPLSRSTAPAPSVATMPTAPHQAESPRSTLSLTVSSSSPDANGVVTFAITTNSDTASLKINGDEEGGRSDGRYSVRRFAQVGENQFEVVATDRFGNTQRQIVSVVRQAADATVRFASLNPTNVRARPATDAVAIIIGIQDYRRVPKAEFANNDARLFYDYAVRGLGVRPENIKLLLDQQADDVEILGAFKNWLPLKSRKGQTDVYVFYSGHGLPSDDGGSLYLLPHGVDRQFLDRTAIKQSEIVSALQAVNPKSVTLFIDACYSGQIRTGEMLLASARPIVIQPKASGFPANFTVISASAPDQLASSSPELKHGVFSYFLMKGMEGEADLNKDGRITIEEMQSYLKEAVGRKAMALNRTQQPQVVGDQSKILLQR